MAKIFLSCRFQRRNSEILLAILLVLPAILIGCTPAPKPRVPQHSTPRVTVVAVGDILLARALGERMETSGDFKLPFNRMGSELSAADIAFGNLEGPFCEKPPYTKEGMLFRIHPRTVEGLVFAGFDVLSVANNHFGDGGNACMEYSLAQLHRSRIAPVGAGLNFEEAHGGAILLRHGVRFAFLGYTYAARNDNSGAKRPVIAGREIESMRRDVAAARARADVVILSLHDGAEYSRNVARETQNFAHAAIDAGATAVLGHHPHVPQRVERYADGWIFYSLGNFVFWQTEPAATRGALMARLTFSGAKLERVEALPVVIESLGIPRLADQEESARILKSVGLLAPILWEAPAH
jgi:poly-gamma-glutamate synthesis protein (capsule biosynthesis protein)